jgi:hypothetical protein
MNILQRMAAENLPFSKQIQELGQLALKIAKRERNENTFQIYFILIKKLEAEQAELEEALATKTRLEAIAEAADCVYYSVQLYVTGRNSVSSETLVLEYRVQEAAQQCNITVEQAYQAALAKYRLRASMPKDFEVENAAIAAAIGL